MTDQDHRPAIHATPTSALRAVTLLLAVVLVLSIASALMDALSTPRPSPAASGPQAHLAVPTIRYLVLMTSAVGARSARDGVGPANTPAPSGPPPTST